MGFIIAQFAPEGQQSAEDDESRDMQTSVDGQQKLLGSFESMEVQELKVELGQEESRCCKTPKACAADIATLRAAADGTTLEARHMRPIFWSIEREPISGHWYLVVQAVQKSIVSIHKVDDEVRGRDASDDWARATNKLERQRKLEAHKRSRESGSRGRNGFGDVHKTFYQTCVHAVGTRYVCRTGHRPLLFLKCMNLWLSSRCPRIASPLTPGSEMRGLVTLDEVNMPECGR
jgi:hypothetical protein